MEHRMDVTSNIYLVLEHELGLAPRVHERERSLLALGGRGELRRAHVALGLAHEREPRGEDVRRLDPRHEAEELSDHVLLLLLVRHDGPAREDEVERRPHLGV